MATPLLWDLPPWLLMHHSVDHLVGTMLLSGGRFWIFQDLPPLLTGAAATSAVVEHEIGENRELCCNSRSDENFISKKKNLKNLPF